jgi:transposase
LVEGHPSLAIIFEPLLQAREALREQLAAIDRQSGMLLVRTLYAGS